MDNLTENGSDHDSGNDEEEDIKEINIGQTYENCKRTQSQQLIRLYGDTSYSLQLNECLRDDLIRRHKFRFLKATQDDPEILTLCSQ